MTAAAMLIYPDFFKVGWSESGNHENNVYNNTWSEKHPRREGDRERRQRGVRVFDREELRIGQESEGAPNAGDWRYHNNVHPANTYRLADALIKANKRFDFLILRGQRHGYTSFSTMSHGGVRITSRSICCARAMPRSTCGN